MAITEQGNTGAVRHQLRKKMEKVKQEAQKSNNLLKELIKTIRGYDGKYYR